MNYSYMPTEPDECSILAFESDQRVLTFRNQYGEKFRFAPTSAIWLVIVLSLTIGFIIGKLI